ncbi:suppressor of cytokine signaling 2-like [Penaeus indicus]|uniref:suppressor of cytokine signaling 2-like n=1 Tax=Penaeus indicus TaxID=29960 RepID=UPI00300D3AAA
MLTCPNCHHVLAAHSCCGLNLAVPSATFPPSAPSGASVASAAALGTRLGPSGGGVPPSLSVSAPPQPQALATPHVSGHMFHFPTALPMPGLPACHSACHVACHASIHTPCLNPCRSPWQWPDSGGSLPGAAMAARMHTSGGGIVDEGAKAAAAAAAAAVHANGVGCDWTAWDDERVLGATRRMLGESGWYWERLSWRQAETLLQSTSLGTFIVRDSADTRFLYSLSVQTERGPTSVRIHYAAGKFRLDCESHMAPSIPDFSTVIALVEHYIRVNQKLQKHFWVDAQGKVYCPITIRQPLKRAVPSLKHLCRLAINLALPRSCSAVRLPPSLCQYIDEYPYWC